MNIKFDNQTESYPVVLIPDNILSFLHSEIDENTIASELNISKPQRKDLKKPEPPSKYSYIKSEKTETELTEHSGCVILIFLGSIITSFFVADSFLEGLKFIVFATVGLSVFFALMLLFNGESLIKVKSRTGYVKVNRTQEELKNLEFEYEDKLRHYNLMRESNEYKYKIELDLYRSKIETNKIKIKRKLFLQNLHPQIAPSRGSLPLKRGTAELRFLEALNSELKGLIFMDMVPRQEWAYDRNTYNPDFTLICDQTNLHIDIEIDEPYSFSEKTPIHFIGSSDDKRNEFFLVNNWCIIRFSEKQILQNTIGCVETVKSIHNSIIDMNPYYSTNVNIDPRWTYEESLIMQKNRYRENNFK